MRQEDVRLSNINHIKGIIVNSAEWLNEKWLIKTIALFLPSIWTQVIIRLLGEYICLCNKNGTYTIAGIISTIIIYIVFIYVSILTAYKTSRDLKRQKDSDIIREPLNK